jgi:hypothetical protein
MKMKKPAFQQAFSFLSGDFPPESVTPKRRKVRNAGVDRRLSPNMLLRWVTSAEQLLLPTKAGT